MKIRDHVEVVSQPTVIRLDQLQEPDSSWISSSFYITTETEKHLHSLRSVLSAESGSGVFLIGHYGSGKSHFLAYVAQQLRSKGFVPKPPDVVTLSLLNYSSAQSLESILDEALGIQHTRKDRRAGWKNLQGRHPAGLFLILDELSEFLRSKPSSKSFNEDLRTLQYLGEWAQDHSFWILAAVQEQIERTGDIEHDLYRKIKDRYPIRFLLTPAHVKDLIAQRILRKKDTYTPAVEKLASEIAEVYPAKAIDTATLCAIYPLHPGTLELLEEVRDRFSQARGIIDFALTRLLGNEARGIPAFLDRPWGSLMTPDLIVDHFSDLFEIQPEFLAIARKALPYFRKNIPLIFEKEAQQELAWRLIKLLILVHLSPRRNSMDAGEAAVWLLLRASSFDPGKNSEIIARMLETLTERGSYVRREGSRYRLELDDESRENLDQLLAGQIAELQTRGDSVFEDLAPLLEDSDFNPLSLPRDRWHTRKARWHFHERDARIYLGGGIPPEEKGAPAIQIGLPWGQPAEGSHYYRIPANRLEITPDILELAALAQLRERPLPAQVLARIEERIAAKKSWFVSLVRSAYRDATAMDTASAVVATPLIPATGGFAGWLQTLCEWALRLTYPSFERFAPGHGPLSKEAYREFLKFASEHDPGSVEAPEAVKLIREAYLVPMKLMQRRGVEYAFIGKLDNHELVKLLYPMIDMHPSPARVYETLSAPVYGLVPDQIHLLLLTLLIQGEIDIVKGQHSLRETYETIPNPLQYDKILPGHALNLHEIRDLQTICEAFHISIPRQWTVLAQKRAIEQLRKEGGKQRDRLSEFLRNLAAAGESEDLAKQVEKVVACWLALEKGDHELQGFQHFLFEIGSANRFVEQATEMASMPDRYEKLLAESRLYRHLLSYDALRNCANADIATRVEALPPQPPVSEAEASQNWIRQAAAVYRDYVDWYKQQHEDWRRSVSGHAIWTYRPPNVARSRHAGVGDVAREIEMLQTRARPLKCAGMDSLDFQSICRCGFTGAESPLTEMLREFDQKRQILESEMTLFFQQDKVKSRIDEWVGQKLEMNTRTLSYLEGKVPFPEVDNVSLFDQYLSGLELVRPVASDSLLDLLGNAVWEKPALLQALEQFFNKLGVTRVRFRREEAAPRRELLAWCCEQALRSGTPLPAAFAPAEYALIPEILHPQWISEKSLLMLEKMELGEAAVDAILRILMDGLIRLPGKAPEYGPVAAAMDLLSPHTPANPAELAQLSAMLYAQKERLERIQPQAWRERLDVVAQSKLATESLESLLKPQLHAQWVVIDCLGLPLVEMMKQVISDVLAHWKLQEVWYGSVSEHSTTSAFYSGLLDAGLLKSFQKVDAVDDLIHNRKVNFAELVRLARAELEIALRKIASKLDTQSPVILFGDHGFRLSRDVSGFTHGGPSTLERLIPVFLLIPR